VVTVTAGVGYAMIKSPKTNFNEPVSLCTLA
jgi:hypothetical protein